MRQDRQALVAWYIEPYVFGRSLQIFTPKDFEALRMAQARAGAGAAGKRQRYALRYIRYCL